MTKGDNTSVAFGLGWIVGIITFGVLHTLVDCERSHETREELLTGKVICVQQNEEWNCKTKEQLESEIKFLQQLQPKQSGGSR